MDRWLKRTFWISFTSYFLVMIFTRFANFPELDKDTRAFYASPGWEFVDDVFRHEQSIRTQTCFLTSQEVADLLRENPQGKDNRYQILTSEKEYVAVRMQSNSDRTYGNLKCYFANFPYAIVVNVTVPYSPIVGHRAHSGPGYRNFFIFPLPENFDSCEPANFSYRWKNYL